ncbi:hypothetical protein VPH35_127209 [Triticum aestivum]
MGLPLLSPYLRSVGSDFRHGANFATLASTVLLPNTSLFVTGISPFSLAIQLLQMKELSNRRWLLFPPFPFPLSPRSSPLPDLYNIGARKFMVFNMAPIGCYPAFLVELPHSSSDLDEYGCMTSYNSAVVYYNELLNNSLTEVRKTLQNASIVYVDKYSAMLELFRHPEDHSELSLRSFSAIQRLHESVWFIAISEITRLKYGTKACCGYGGGAYNFDPDMYCGTNKIVKGNIASAIACGDPQNYESWDGIHATETANLLD